MKMIIAGGRDNRLTDHDIVCLNDIHTVLNVTEVVSGHARGIDKDGEKWAAFHKIPIKLFEPDYDRFKKGAPLVRNKEMADYADALAVFPGNIGTSHMYASACERGLMIFDFRELL